MGTFVHKSKSLLFLNGVKAGIEYVNDSSVRVVGIEGDEVSGYSLKLIDTESNEALTEDHDEVGTATTGT